MEERASSEVNNFDICEKITKKHFSVGNVRYFVHTL